MYNNFFNDNSEYNRYVNLDAIEWKIIDHLVKSPSLHAKKLWKMLYYNSPDCLTQDDLISKQKYGLVYRDNGESSSKKVFMMPFVDDGWTEQSSRLDVFVDKISAQNHVNSTVDVCFEIVVHNKINNIYGEAEEGDPESNPAEIDEEGNTIILSKSRATTMLKHLIAELNGTFVNGVGTLQLNQQVSPYSNVRSYVWNNRSYFGFSVVFSTFMGGVSSNSEKGW